MTSQFKLDRTYRLVVPRPSLKFSGPGEGQSARPPAKTRERAVRPFHRYQPTMPWASLVLTLPSAPRTMPCARRFDLSSAPTDNALRQLGLTFSSVPTDNPRQAGQSPSHPTSWVLGAVAW